MPLGSDEEGDNSSYAFSPFEEKELEETRSFTRKCGSKIEEDRKKFARKSALGLWWDAKGIFKSSNATVVSNHMELNEKFYKEIDTLFEQVQKGDTNAYKELLKMYEKSEEVKRNAQIGVEKNQSSAIRQMQRKFLDKKPDLDYSLKKIECIVLKQKNSEVEKSLSIVNEMMKKMDNVEEFMGKMRKKEEELAETEERYEARILELEKENEKLRLEADKRNEAIRREAEERAEARIREIVKENEKLRLEAEKIRRESDEKLKQAIDEANRIWEARIQQITEQNRASLQQMMKVIEALNLP